MGIITNLIRGWAGARSSLNRTLLAVLALRIVTLVTLTFHKPSWQKWISVGFVMGAQALAGVALLSWIGYDGALWSVAALIAVSLTAVAILLNDDIG